MNKLGITEPVFKTFEYYPSDCDDHKTVLVAFLPKDIMDAFNEHCSEFNDSEIDYIDEVLGEYGYSDEDIFFYFEESDYAKVIKDHPEDGDILAAVDEDGEQFYVEWADEFLSSHKNIHELIADVIAYAARNYDWDIAGYWAEVMQSLEIEFEGKTYKWLELPRSFQAHIIKAKFPHIERLEVK